MTRDLEHRLGKLEKATAPPELQRDWQRIIIKEGDLLPPDLDPGKGLILRVIVDPKPPQEVQT